MARPAETDAATQRVLAQLEQRELLLQAGREFPSIANIVAGEEIRGSWWAHPKSNLVYWVCQDLEQHPRIAEARLIAGKVTHLWQTVWPHIAAIALSRAPWVGAAAMVLLFVVVGPAPVAGLAKIAIAALALLPLLVMTDSGAFIVDLLPWIGSIDASNVEGREEMTTVVVRVILNGPNIMRVPIVGCVIERSERHRYIGK